VVGNLPYNISSPLLFHLADLRSLVMTCTSCCRRKWSTAWWPSPAPKDFGRLSVMLQYRFHMERVFDVPPGAFNPPPKVDSAIVRAWLARKLAMVGSAYLEFRFAGR
jgi:16S rRNA (adenine1518-N6/adenine1519-N6)-dimethyltransferase